MKALFVTVVLALLHITAQAQTESATYSWDGGNTLTYTRHIKITVSGYQVNVELWNVDKKTQVKSLWNKAEVLHSDFNNGDYDWYGRIKIQDGRTLELKLEGQKLTRVNPDGETMIYWENQ